MGTNRSEHRGSYMLERGVWVVTCIKCGWRAADPNRRQATVLFRRHINEQLALAEAVDLREARPDSLPSVSVLPVTVASEPKPTAQTAEAGI